MKNENPLKDISLADLNRYCKELGYYLSKMPEKLVPLKRCTCGRKPYVRLSLAEAYVICPGCGKVSAHIWRHDDNGRAMYTKHELCNLARKSWNEMIEKEVE